MATNHSGGSALILGGTGFVGTRTAMLLRESGWQVRTFSRRVADSPDHVSGDVTDSSALREAASGAEVLINTVGLTALRRPAKGRTYEGIHVGAVRNLIQAAEGRPIVHISAAGASSGHPAEYLRTKGQAEELLLASRSPVTILAPSVIFGRGNEIDRMFARLAVFPFVPVPAVPVLFQPVFVEDLARLVLAAAGLMRNKGKAFGTALFDVGGPDRMPAAEFFSEMLRLHGIRTMGIPSWLTLPGVRIVSALGIMGAPKDLHEMLGIDNVAVRGLCADIGVGENHHQGPAEDHLKKKKRRTASARPESLASVLKVEPGTRLSSWVSAELDKDRALPLR